MDSSSLQADLVQVGCLGLSIIGDLALQSFVLRFLEGTR